MKFLCVNVACPASKWQCEDIINSLPAAPSDQSSESDGQPQEVEIEGASGTGGDHTSGHGPNLVWSDLQIQQIIDEIYGPSNPAGNAAVQKAVRDGETATSVQGPTVGRAIRVGRNARAEVELDPEEGNERFGQQRIFNQSLGDVHPAEEFQTLQQNVTEERGAETAARESNRAANDLGRKRKPDSRADDMGGDTESTASPRSSRKRTLGFEPDNRRYKKQRSESPRLEHTRTEQGAPSVEQTRDPNSSSVDDPRDASIGPKAAPEGEVETEHVEQQQQQETNDQTNEKTNAEGVDPRVEQAAQEQRVLIDLTDEGENDLTNGALPPRPPPRSLSPPTIDPQLLHGPEAAASWLDTRQFVRENAKVLRDIFGDRRP